MLPPDRLLPADPGVRGIARRIFDHTQALPIVSPHGHVAAQQLADDEVLGDPARELIVPDHYLLRMLYSQGVPLERLGVHTSDGRPSEQDGRLIWRTFVEHFHLFRGTPSRWWLEYTLSEVFGVAVRLDAASADEVYDQLCARLSDNAFRPRALYERFGIELLASTDSALDTLDAHTKIAASGWGGRVVPTFRPDDVVDPDGPKFLANLDLLGEMTGHETTTWPGYLDAIRARREVFIDAGASASDHGHPTANTADLSPAEAATLFDRVRTGSAEPGDAELFRSQMLVELAAMSVEDGLVMQLHCGSWRNHNPTVRSRFGADKGADIPQRMDYVGALKPLLDRFGNDPRLTLVVYTLDETTYSRELAPLAGHYPALRLGPPWWFHDSPEGIRRFRHQATETAGFYNTVGFNDDARSLLTIPARHDMARRLDAGFLADLVAEHRIEEDEAIEVAEDLALTLARHTFRTRP